MLICSLILYTMFLAQALNSIRKYTHLHLAFYFSNNVSNVEMQILIGKSEPKHWKGREYHCVDEFKNGVCKWLTQKYIKRNL